MRRIIGNPKTKTLKKTSKGRASPIKPPSSSKHPGTSPHILRGVVTQRTKGESSRGMESGAPWKEALGCSHFP